MADNAAVVAPPRPIEPDGPQLQQRPNGVVEMTSAADPSGEGLSKLQLLRNQFRSKIVEEKERKLNLLNKKQAATLNFLQYVLYDQRILKT